MPGLSASQQLYKERHSTSAGRLEGTPRRACDQRALLGSGLGVAGSIGAVRVHDAGDGGSASCSVDVLGGADGEVGCPVFGVTGFPVLAHFDDSEGVFRL